MGGVHRKIEKMVQNIDGWAPHEQLFALYLLVKASNLVGHVIEIGSYCGKSSTVLAEALSKNLNEKLYCVDAFPEFSDWYQNVDGSWSFKTLVQGKYVLGCQEATVWDEPFQKSIRPTYRETNSLLKIFQQNIANNGQSEKVQIVHGNSDYLSTIDLDKKSCKLIYIDGDHGYKQVINDIKNVEKFLKPGGFICFDDAFSGYSGVDRAIETVLLNNTEYHNFEQITRKMFIAQRKN